ncbi:MAG TPA: hypothetical protein VMK12_31795 [Anaeromyxobacteraceae bacterium]|nr:hypothetical protein [Anaeromyxobacteraceae bacterium]
MRGRLLNAFVAELAQLDVAATAADPDGSGPLASGYDPDFKETVLLPTGGSVGTDARKEKPALLLPCQVEVGAFEALQELASGNSPASRVTLVFHFRDLEERGLVDPATGDALIRVNDRLVAIRDRHDSFVQAIRTPPGLYVREAQPQFGLGTSRNLLAVTFEQREQGVRNQ